MKNLKDHIEDLEAVNEFYDDTAIREAIAFIKELGKDLHDAQNQLVHQLEWYVENKLLKQEIEQLKATNQNLINQITV